MGKLAACLLLLCSWQVAANLQLHNNQETTQPERSISGPTTVTAQPAQKLWGGGLFGAGQASNVQPLPLLQAAPRLPVAAAAAGSILFHKLVEKHATGHSSGNRPHPACARYESFVGVNNGSFVTGTKSHGNTTCEKLYVSGANRNGLLAAAIGKPNLDFNWDPLLTPPEIVRDTLDEVKASGQNVIRVFAFVDVEAGPDYDSAFSALYKNSTGQPAVREEVLHGLDYILDEANKRCLKVIIVLSSFFAEKTAGGGPRQFLTFDPSYKLWWPKEDFFTNQYALAAYDFYVEKVVTRRNSVNGHLYVNDPTIFAYDIFNEPRCSTSLRNKSPCTTDTIKNFTQTASGLVRSLDSTHLITVGLDGFWDDPTKNPIGQNGFNADFEVIGALPNINFLEFNWYPDLWGNYPPGTGPINITKWLADHAAAAIRLGKPAIVKEFGAQPSKYRFEYYEQTYAAVAELIVAQRNAAGGLKGILFFEAFSDGTWAPWWELAPGGRWGIYPTSKEWTDVVDPFTLDPVDRLNSGERTVSCPAGKSELLVPRRRESWVCKNGNEGFPECKQPVNDCLRGMDECSPYAACINLQGLDEFGNGYTCECWVGYEDVSHGHGIAPGRQCRERRETPLDLLKHKHDPALSDITGAYCTNFSLDTSSTSNVVPYPHTAPGWAYNPVCFVDPKCRDTFNYKNQNQVPVTLEECKLACATSKQDGTNCTSFRYNFGTLKCILYQNQDPSVPQVPSVLISNCFGLNYTGVPPNPATDFPFYPCDYAASYYDTRAFPAAEFASCRNKPRLPRSADGLIPVNSVGTPGGPIEP